MLYVKLFRLFEIMFKKIRECWRNFKKKQAERSILSGDIPRGLEASGLDANTCWNVTRFKRYTDDLDLIVREKVSEVNNIILEKIRSNRDESLIAITKTPANEDICKLIGKAFADRGFTVLEDHYIPSIDTKVLVISWKPIPEKR